MKKILLVGKFNNTLKELYDRLSRRFQIQVSAEQTELVQGMIQITNPDMVLLHVMEMDDIDEGIFDLLDKIYKKLPVLVIGTKEACDKYKEQVKREQMMCLVSPVSRDVILQSCYQLLGEKDLFSRFETASEEDGGMKQILVVDDSPVILRGIKSMLDKNYQILVATSGELALKTLKKEQVDLILMDYEMPGLNGKETLERIREDVDIKDTPVIFLTGVDDKEHISAVLKLNPAGYFLKPVEKERLISAIEEVLNK